MNKLLTRIRAHKKLLIFGIIGAGLIALIPIMVLGCHSILEVVDSTAFCTDVCHSVHAAETVVYNQSAHSQVTCATCHVGAGTKNLVRSKLRGLTDIIPAITGDYPKPIPTPLEDLRPSRETCEKCHTSGVFYGDVPLIKTHFAADQTNTKTTTTLVLKAGGGSPLVSSGIHWHTTAKVWYLPLDQQRLEIGWVGVEDSTGAISDQYINPVYASKVTSELILSDKRLMDCVDCHNRTAHTFSSPNDLIDTAMANGSIDPSLPYIKQQALQALTPQAPSLQAAYDKIAKIKDYYKTSYPDISQQKATAINNAVAQLKAIAQQTTFGDNLSWTTYLDNLGHDKPDANGNIDFTKIAQAGTSPGCFRCHGVLVKTGTPGGPPAPTPIPIPASPGTVAKNISSALASGAGDSIINLGAISNPGASSGIKNAEAGPPTPGAGTADPLKDTVTADCGACHHTFNDTTKTPIAPAVSHPVDGLDDCLICHGPNGARPFKSTHPWTTNEACLSCHQSAPKLSTFPVSTPPKAPDISHSTKKLDNCLTCHGPSSASPLKSDHPWATNETCAACHKPASDVKPVSASPITVSTEIPHSISGLDACSSCHYPSGPAKFPDDHAGRPDNLCTICHKPTANAPQPAILQVGPDIPHGTSGLTSCSMCHNANGPAGLTGSHAGRPDSFCTLCHKQSKNLSTPVPAAPSGPAIPHPLDNVHGDCLLCHGGSGLLPAPQSSHAGLSDAFCQLCHKPGATAVIPSAPTNLVATAVSPTQTNISWSGTGTGNTGTKLERASDANFTSNLFSVNLPATSNSYIDISVSGPNTYYYRVSLLNSIGTSPASTAATVVLPAPGANVPLAPTNLTATAKAGQVNLSWSDSPSNNQTGYRIERANNSSFTSGLTPFNSTIKTYIDSTVSGSTTYFYRVIGYNLSGNSLPSNNISVTTGAATIDAAALYATNCAMCHGANQQGGSASALTPTALSGVSLAQVTTYINSGIGTMPGYSATLTSAQIASIAQMLKGSPPAAPTSLSSTAISAGQVNISWTDNATNETSYTIQRATDTGFTTGLITSNIAANSSAYSDLTTAGLTAYYYRVYASNASGNSAMSNTANVTTPISTVMVPSAPTSLSATAISATQVNLSWTDNANNETGFQIDRATNNTFTTGLVSVSVAMVNTTSYTDATVSASTTYYYRVYASNSGGNSIASNVITITTPAVPIDATALYSTNCAICHGANMQGGSASALTSSVLASVSLTTVTNTITNGTSGMPGYSSSLSSAQIAAIAGMLKGAPPAAPSSLSANAASPGQVNLTWVVNSTNETGFIIQRAIDSAFTTGMVSMNTTVGALSYCDTTTVGSTTYYYRVFALNATGNSAMSNTATVTTPISTVTAPTSPTGLVAAATSSTQVNLTWTDNSNNETGFQVDRATNSTFTAGLVSVNLPTVNTTSYTDSIVSASTTYYYRVYASNSGGNSTASNIATVTTPAPGPADVYAANCSACHGSNGQGGASPAVAGAAATTTNIIVRGGGPTMPAFTTSQISATNLTAMATYVRGLAPAPTTGSAIYALNCAVCHGTNGQGTAMAPDLAGVAASIINSSTRSGLGTIMPAYNTADLSSTQLTTLGSYIAALGPAPVDGWGVYAEYCAMCHGTDGRSGSGGRIAGDSANMISSAVRGGTGSMPSFTTTQISNTALTNLQAYVSGLGGTTTPTVPSAPSSLSATANGANQVNLTWTDNASNETGYTVQRATNTTFSTGLTSFSLSASSVSYGDTSVIASTMYYYRVYASNSAGNSGYSNTMSVTTPAATTTGTVPAAPTNLTATATSSTQVNLTWRDNASNETGYTVQRATNSGFTSGLVTTNIASNSVSYSDTTVIAGTTYYYRVYARNSAGNSSTSNSVSVTTPTGTALNGATLFTANCTSCHGVRTTTMTQAQLLTWMPTHNTGRTLTSAQIAAIAAYLKP